jgi:hypothetical protein
VGEVAYEETGLAEKKPSFLGEYDTSRFFVCWWYSGSASLISAKRDFLHNRPEAWPVRREVWTHGAEVPSLVGETSRSSM